MGRLSAFWGRLLVGDYFPKSKGVVQQDADGRGASEVTAYYSEAPFSCFNSSRGGEPLPSGSRYVGCDPASVPCLGGGKTRRVAHISGRKMREAVSRSAVIAATIVFMRRLRIEVIVPEDAVEDAPTRVHELLTREGWVLRRVDDEEIDWVEGLDLLRETLDVERNAATLLAAADGEIKNSFVPVVEEGDSVRVESGPHRVP